MAENSPNDAKNGNLNGDFPLADDGNLILKMSTSNFQIISPTKWKAAQKRPDKLNHFQEKKLKIRKRKQE